MFLSYLLIISKNLYTQIAKIAEEYIFKNIYLKEFNLKSLKYPFQELRGEARVSQISVLS